MKPDKVEQLVDRIESLIAEGRQEELRPILDAAHPADVADAIERLDDDERQVAFELLAHEQAGDVLVETDEATRSEIVEDMEVQDLSKVVQTLPPDEAADIVGELPDEQSEELLDQLPDEAAEPIEDILKYDEESAGGIMTPVLIRVRDNMTVREAIQAIQQGHIEGEDEIFYVYAVDAEDRLVGVVRIRRLLLSPPETPISEILQSDVASVPVDADQEDIAELFEKYDHLAIPVVDHAGKLVGRITIDDVVDVIEEEVTEDVYKMAGTDDAELATHSVFKIARIRTPWLFGCLGGTLASGAILRAYEMTLEQTMGLVAFVPAIMATGGNSGIQTSTVTVRSLATGDLDPGRVLEAFLREVRVALVLALLCGLASGLVAHLWVGERNIGLVVGAAMFLGISIAATFGALLPLGFRKVGIDPAVACGPLITTTNDIISLFIYLTLAKMLIGG